ncbi:thiocyanate hydrolase subunit gamma [Fluoribacter dumoffii]|uniref:thiocyanate hydrolase subunit gamma n=1 Tax=Fluoribacter dumoffii TaxID=463 RepID=UPI002243DBE4|nr:thiocyanate hydrolase subunit gamma [Fluoribacter dumoffii]MCW8386488.1 thiocyanate hydrolase subunit gamma [Fluoribacter dumoffii]MCW8498238.1 thiocyanate hydrolase subunit gamma [Fluoribacter dumoffii]
MTKKTGKSSCCDEHDHLHEHSHDSGDEYVNMHPIKEREEAIEFTILEAAIRELCIEKGLFSADDHRRFVEWYESIGPMGGARVVARAWVDPEFKKRLLKDGVAACLEMGIDWMKPTGSGTPSDYTFLLVCENTPKVHHTMVCTLCSCYPRPLLGTSPAWYERMNYRRRMVRWPRQLLAEFGTIIPEDVEVRVHDSNQKTRYMILPMRPAGTEDWTEEQLQTLVTRDTMIGVTLPKVERLNDNHPGNQKNK